MNSQERKKLTKKRKKTVRYKNERIEYFERGPWERERKKVEFFGYLNSDRMSHLSGIRFIIGHVFL